MSLAAQLELLPADRADAVRRWLQTSLGECASCQRPVLPIHPREHGKDGPRHLDCTAAPAPPPAAEEPVSAAVEARARRSDWG